MFLFVVLKTQSVDVLMVLTLVASVILVNSLLYLFWTAMGHHLSFVLSLKMWIVALGMNLLRSGMLSFMSALKRKVVWTLVYIMGFLHCSNLC